jgi:hypothetical protein
VGNRNSYYYSMHSMATFFLCVSTTPWRRLWPQKWRFYPEDGSGMFLKNFGTHQTGRCHNAGGHSIDRTGLYKFTLRISHPRELVLVFRAFGLINLSLV